MAAPLTVLVEPSLDVAVPLVAALRRAMPDAEILVAATDGRGLGRDVDLVVTDLPVPAVQTVSALDDVRDSVPGAAVVVVAAVEDSELRSRSWTRGRPTTSRKRVR